MGGVKRHTDAEIAAKLVEAGTLVAEGQTQDAIARTLGISVMTFHRWRKAYPYALRSNAAGGSELEARLPVAQSSDPGHDGRYAALKSENMRLRKLVTDLLLEKMRLEDERQHNSVRISAEKS
jgi:putative transposase